MDDWELRFDSMLIAFFRKDEIEGDVINITGKDLPSTKAFIQELLDEQSSHYEAYIRGYREARCEMPTRSK